MLIDSILLTANRLAKSISQILVTVILARILTVEEMGIYQQIFLIAIMIGSFIPFELQTTFSYFYNRTDNLRERSRILSNTFVVLTILGSVTFFILMVLFESGLFFKDSHLKEYSLWTALWCLATILGSYLENLFISTKRAKIFSITTLVYYTLFLLGIAYFIFTNHSLVQIVQVIAVLEILRVMILHLVFVTKQKISLKIDMSLLKKQINYTLAVGSVTAIEVLTQNTDKIIIGIFFSVQEFAVFSLAAKEIPFASIITVAAITAMLPRLGEIYGVQKNPEAALALWTKTSRTLAIIIFPIFWILLFYHREFIELLYSEAYLSGALIFVVYLLKFPLRFTVFYTLLLISGNQKLLVWNSVITVVLNLVLSLIFLYFFGYIGVAAATVVTAYIGIYLQQRDVCKVFQIKQTALLPYKKIFSTFFLSGLSTGLVFFLTSLVHVHHFIQFFIGGFLSVVLCLSVAVFRKEISLDVLFKNKVTRKVVPEKSI